MSSAGPAISPPSSRRLFKDVLQGSGIYLFGSLAQKLASLLVVPITTRCLTTAEFGISDLIEQCTNVLSMLLGARFGSALGYFYYQKNTAEERRPIVITSIIGAALLGLLATLITRPFSSLIATSVFGDVSIARYFNLLLLLMPVSFVAEAAYSLLRVENRPVAFTVMSSLRLVLQIAGLVVFVALLKLRLMGVVYASCVAAVTVGIVITWYCIHRFGATFELATFNRMVRYSAPMSLTGVAFFFIHVGDRFILPHYRSFSDLGIYVLAYKFGMLISFLYSSFSTYWGSQSFAIMRREDADIVFARMFTYVALGLCFCAVALTVCSPPALRIMSAREFWGATSLIPVVIGAYFFRSIADFFRVIFYTEGRPGADAVSTWIGTAVCGAGYWLLIPRWGMWGAAYATMTSFAVMGVVTVVWCYRIRAYRIEAGRLLKVALASVAALAPYCIIPASSLPVLIGSAALSLTLFPLTLWILRFLTPGEWQMATQAVMQVRQRFA